MTIKEALQHPINLSYISVWIGNLIAQFFFFSYRGSLATLSVIALSIVAGYAANTYLLLHDKKRFCIYAQFGIALVSIGMYLLFNTGDSIETATLIRYIVIMFFIVILAGMSPQQAEEKQIEFDAMADYFAERKKKKKSLKSEQVRFTNRNMA